MEIKKAIILCAGFGKRVLPLTKNKPKPLLEVNNKPLIEYSIKLLNEIGIKHICVNTHYLSDQIKNYIHQNYPSIEIFEEKTLLDTGGALVNAKKFLMGDYFLVLNSDTIWQRNYIKSITKLIDTTITKNFLGGLLLCRKDKSFDKALQADFDIDGDFLIQEKKHIYTGFQILHSSLLENRETIPFSVREIWDQLIEEKKITAEVFEEEFYHTTNFEIYNQLQDQKIIF